MWLTTAAVGLTLFIAGAVAGPSLWKLGLLVGGVLVALGLGVAGEYVFKLSPEGVTIKRGGYLLTDKLVRWPSIRRIEHLSEKDVVLHLLDDSLVHLRLGALTEEGRASLSSELRQRATLSA